MSATSRLDIVSSSVRRALGRYADISALQGTGHLCFAPTQARFRPCARWRSRDTLADGSEDRRGSLDEDLNRDPTEVRIDPFDCYV